MRWTFGERAARRDRRARRRCCAGSTGLVLSLEAPRRRGRAPHRRAAQRRGGARALASRRSRRRGSAPNADGDGRVYLDHSRDIGAFNPCFPTTRSRVDGDRGAGHGRRSRSPTRARPGIVHGGFLAVFFDCVIQHHNCDVGRRRQDHRPRAALPAADAAAHRAARSRSSARVDDRGSTSTARLLLDGDGAVRGARCGAVAGDRAAPARGVAAAGRARDRDDDRRRRRAAAHRPRAAARAGRARGDAVLLVVRRRRPHLRGRRAPIGRARPGPARRGRGQGHARRHPPPQRQRVRRRLARRRPDRRGERAAQHVLDQPPSWPGCCRNADVELLLSASSYRSHDYVGRAARRPSPSSTSASRRRCSRGSVPVAASRRASSTRRPRRRSGVDHALRSRSAAGRSSRACSRRRRPTVSAGDRMVDRAHLGLDQRRRRA